MKHLEAGLKHPDNQQFRLQNIKLLKENHELKKENKEVKNIFFKFKSEIKNI